MRSVFNDYVCDQLHNRDEEVNMDYHWDIKDQRMKAERNQMRHIKTIVLILFFIKFIFIFISFLFLIFNVTKVFLHGKIH
jgi:hypothetical protein